MCATYMQVPSETKTGSQIPLELELQMMLSCSVSSGRLSKCSEPLIHLSSHLKIKNCFLVNQSKFPVSSVLPYQLLTGQIKQMLKPTCRLFCLLYVCHHVLVVLTKARREGTGSPRTTIWVLELSLGPLEKHPVLLNAEPSLESWIRN